MRHLHQQATARCECSQAIDQAVDQRIVACLGGELGAFPALLFSQLTLGGPHAEHTIASVGLGFAGQPEFIGVGVAFSLAVMADLILRVQAVQLGEVEFGVIIFDEGRPIAAFGQPTQPAQLHPVGLGQVTVFGEEFLYFGVARGFQACGQFVISQIGLQRIIAQSLAVTEIRAGIAFGQGTLGFIVVLALGGQVHRLGGLSDSGCKKQT